VLLDIFASKAWTPSVVDGLLNGGTVFLFGSGSQSTYQESGRSFLHMTCCG